MARRPLALPPSAIDRWCQYVQGDVSHVAEATGFVNLELSFDEQRQRRSITPEHYVITFCSREKCRQRFSSSLLTLHLVPESSLPEQVQVGVEVRGRGGESVVCNGEYLEFELLSLVNDASKQPPLKIASGPVRMNPETQQREFMRIDLGRCVRQIVTDIIDDPKHKGQKLVRSRWWICVEVLRLVCSANSLDCSALDSSAAAPLEWVICLVDEKGTAGSGGGGSGAIEDAKAPEEKSIDELAKFIDGGAKRSKAKQRRKKAKGEDAVDDATELEHEDFEGSSKASTSFCPLPSMSAVEVPRVGAGAAPPRPAPPPGWSRTVDLAPALVDAWQDSAGCAVRHIAESTGFVHFFLSYSAEQGRLRVAPVHYVIAFPHVTAGQQRCHSALLKMSIVADCEIPGGTEGRAGSIGFELLARENEAPVHTPLRFTTGPVRVNDSSGQRESMRLDLGDSVRWAPPDIVEGVVSGCEQRLVRQRWWFSIETVRVICNANGLDSSGLDSAGAPAVEWVACLVDDRPSNTMVRPAAPAEASEARAPPGVEQLSRLMNNLRGICSDAAVKKVTRKAKEEEAKAKALAASAGSVGGASAKETPHTAQEGSMPSQSAESERRPIPAVAPQPSRTLAVHTALIDSWCQFARKTVSHVAEASGFVHFEISFDAGLQRRRVSPEHYIIAFPNRDKGRQRYHSSLLTMNIVKESEIPQDYVIKQAGFEQRCGADPDYVEFELLLRIHEASAQQQQLRITAGPVRTNPETGQRESMRIDLGRCVREIYTEIIDDPRGKRVVRNRWWICVETLRLVCTANVLDCSALDQPTKQPMEWVMCLIDERTAQPIEAPQQQEERNIDDLVSFISGKAEKKKKKKKKKDKDKGKADEASQAQEEEEEDEDEEDPVAQAVAEAVAGATRGTCASRPASANSQQLQLEAAVRLLAEAAASCTSSPQQAAVAAAAAAAAEAAKKAAEAASSGPDAAAGQPQILRRTAAPATPAAPRKAAAEYLQAMEAAGGAPGVVPTALHYGQHLPAKAPKSSPTTRPLRGGWEPEPSLLSSHTEALKPASVNELGISAALRATDPASRAFGGLAELETLLAGLRSEFAEARGSTPKRRDGRSAADLLQQGGYMP